jgi:S1-C subfamily serine protease
MTLALHVLTGSRAGTNHAFDGPRVTVGRHAASDFPFDPQLDLDVSTRHAELRELGGEWTVVDEGSTNGTYVNGVRVNASRAIYDGDVISFGANGPRVQVKSGAGPRPSTATPNMGTGVSRPQGYTEARVAVSVKEQTRAMRRMFAGSIVALVIVGAGVLVWAQRQSAAREAELNALIARADSTTLTLQRAIASGKAGDSATTRELSAELDLKKQELERARQNGATRAGIEQLSRSMTPMLSVGQMDVHHIVEANDAAVTFIVADLGGVNMGGTGFAISAGGLLVTNRHVVTDSAGQPARRVMVKFANTAHWKPAHVLRVSSADDLALLQVDEPGKVPMVAGVSRVASRATVGSPVVTMGYPLSNDTPMEGEGMNFTARTTTTLGTVSKRLDDILQLDSFSAHGASGSPVFDSEGSVVGVIYGGARESGGRIVYAVPAQRLVQFLGADGVPVLR